MATAKKNTATKLSADTKKKLLRLADRLDKVKPSHFDLYTWYGVEDDKATKAVLDRGFAKTAKIGTAKEEVYQPNENGRRGSYVEKKIDRVVLLDEGFCGSVACVLGHAALIPEFTRKGLYIEVTDIEKIKNRRKADGYTFYGGKGEVVYKDPKKPRARLKNNFDAGAAFFGLTENQADAVFGGERSGIFYNMTGDKEPTPKRVAKYIRKLVESNGAYFDDVETRYQALNV